MSLGGSPAHRLKLAEDESERLLTELREMELPHPKTMYRLGDEELMTRVMILTTRKVLVGILKVDETEFACVLQETYNAEVEKIINKVREQRRAALTDGI